jgi:hypothetical protein
VLIIFSFNRVAYLSYIRYLLYEKNNFLLITLIFLFTNQFSERKERKRMWKKSMWAKKRGKKRMAFNPYLDKKKKDKPSSKMAKEEREGVRKMRRDYKKQNKRNMKKLGIKPTKVKKA